MKKSKLFAVICSASLILGSVFSAIPAMADSVGTKVVTLGNDLTQEQKNTMLRYFNVNQNEAKILLVTNTDERNHLLGYVPESVIGTNTLSCAYVNPTSSGGIKVRTANLNWVTCNMIASSLSTAGVKNCEVVAACPIQVSGTGALTGVQMAYEHATGQALDPAKKKLAAQEVVVTERYASDVGKKAATNVINKGKIEVIQNNIVNNNEIYNTVVNIAQQNNYNITVEQAEEIAGLLQKISEQGYDYEDVKDTLESVDKETDPNEETDPDEIAAEQLAAEEEDSILIAVDPDELGDDAIEDSTIDPTLAEMTGNSDEVEVSQAVMDFEFDEDLAQETEDNLAVTEDELIVDDPSIVFDPSEEPINDLADGGLAEADPVDGEQIIDTDMSNEQVIADIDDGTQPTEPEMIETQPTETQAADSLNPDALSEQTKYQFEKAQAFCKAEFEGDQTMLNSAVGDDIYNYTYATVMLDPATGQTISKAVQNAYYNVLSGVTPYTPDGTETYMNSDLNMMNQYLKQFFGIQNGIADPAAANLSEADRMTLYKDSIRFFETMYGEVQDNSFNMPAEDSMGDYVNTDMPVEDVNPQDETMTYDNQYQDMPEQTDMITDDYDYDYASY